MRPLLALFLLACTSAETPEPAATGPLVWVAREAVPVGQTLTEADLEQRPVAWLAPDQAPPSLEALIGTTPREPLDAGEPVRPERLAQVDAVGVAAIVPPGLRALTVPVTTVVGLRAGTYADVYCGSERTGPVLRAITLIGVHEGEGSQPPALTLAVTPAMVRWFLEPQRVSVSIAHPVAVTHIDQHGSERLPGAGQPGTVAVARRDLYPGVPLIAEDLVELPAPGWADTLPLADAVGRVTLERVLAGEAVQGADLADPAAGTGLETLMPRDMRLVYVPVAGGRHQGVAPGAYVDVVGWSPETGAEVVAQGLFVAAAVPAEGDRPPHLGLVADYGTTHRLMAALNRTDVALTPVIRGIGDETEADFEL